MQAISWSQVQMIRSERSPAGFGFVSQKHLFGQVLKAAQMGWPIPSFKWWRIDAVQELSFAKIVVGTERTHLSGKLLPGQTLRAVSVSLNPTPAFAILEICSQQQVDPA
jgi:hypothetical protein